MSQNFTAISTKVSQPTKEALEKLCAKRGITLYEMLQMVCDTLVRFMSDDINLHDDIKDAIRKFQGMAGWKGAFNLADFTIKPKVDKAIYFVGNENRHGLRAVMVRTGEMYPLSDEWIQTTNEQDILEELFNDLFLPTYRRLRSVGASEECTKVLETIDILCRKYEQEDDMTTIRKEFEDCNRGDYGQKPADQPYKRHNHRDIDSVIKQQTFQPIGGEW